MLATVLLWLFVATQVALASIPVFHPPIQPGNNWEFDLKLRNYAVLAPKTLLIGQPYSLAVNLLTPQAVGLSRIEASLACTPGRHGYEPFSLSAEWSRQSLQVELQRSIVVSMRLTKPPKQIDFSSKCQLSVKLTDTSDRTFSDTGVVTVSAASTEVFIQTDKAIYKPGQVVKFRVVTVSKSFRPVYENITVFVRDAEGNLVDRFEHRPKQTSTNVADAVFTGEFRLSDQPNLGDWNLIAEIASGKETKSFTVDKYVLPKLELRLQLPDFVHLNDTEFSITAEPVYTYDKVAEGDLSVSVSVQHSCSGTAAFHGYSMCNFTLTGQPVKSTKATSSKNPSSAVGPVELKFSLNDWRSQLAAKGTTVPAWTGVSAFVKAEFVEKFSGLKTLTNKTFNIYRDLFKLEMDTSSVDFVLPGMTVPVVLKLIRPDGKPYLGRLPPGDVTLRVSWYVRGILTSKVFSASVDALSSGSWTARIPIPEDSDFNGISLEAGCPGLLNKVYSHLRSFQTRGSSAVRVQVEPDGRLADGGLTVKVFRGRGIQSGGAFCAVISQEGSLVEWLPMSLYSSSADAADGVSSATLTAARVASLAPRFILLAVGFHGNELVAASLTYQLPGSYDGVRLTSNVTGAASPQQPVQISVSAGPDSIVFLTGIDHSVNLMKSGQDINGRTIEQRAAASSANKGDGGGPQARRYRWWQPTPSTESELEKSGLIALTDFNYMKDVEPMIYAMRANMEMGEGAMLDAAPMAMAKSASAKESAVPAAERPAADRGGKAVSVRKFFPESFVWTWLQTDSTGSANHTVSLPDTITSWDVTGFALSTGSPLQAAPAPLNIVSRQLFFIRPVLPYALVRGEKFLLKVLIFNYGLADVTAKLTLRSDPSFRLIGDDGPVREVAVPSASSALAVFAVEPVQLPEMKLALTAEAGILQDAVERRVRVDAEGAVQRRVASVLLNLTTSAAVEHLLAVEFPGAGELLDGKELVDGSEFARIQVTGTVLGASVSNLERLLRMPYGCGEQNMINFAPAVFVLDCMGPAEATRDIVTKAVEIMKTGYQRELTYRRSDGSYSAFGNSDPAGSTWLTAFVLSVYAQAASFITIDPEAVSGQSLTFLLSQQRSDGSFVESGRVIHAEMQGAGASGAAGLTAYVCASLVRILTSCHRRPELRSAAWTSQGPAALAALRRGLGYVQSSYRSRPADFRPSDLAVASYAARLTVLESDTGDFGVRTTDTDVKVANFLWRQLYEASQSDGETKRFWPGSSGSPTGSAETTGYALMAALFKGDWETAALALRWLSSKQGDLGGFQSTQDTVVGLQAMAQFAKANPAGDGAGNVTVTWPGQSKPLQFLLGPANRILLQRRDVGRGSAARALSGRVSVSGVGSGIAMVTVAYGYNLKDAPRGWLSADWTESAGLALRLGSAIAGAAGSVELSVCARSAAADRKPGAAAAAGMHILSLTNPSGFGVDAHSPIGGAVARVEKGPQDIVFYLNELSAEEICLTARWIREVPVLDLSPQRISVQDYYQPDRQVSLFHLHPELKGLTECKVCPDCPKCRVQPPNNEL